MFTSDYTRCIACENVHDILATDFPAHLTKVVKEYDDDFELDKAEYYLPILVKFPEKAFDIFIQVINYPDDEPGIIPVIKKLVSAGATVDKTSSMFNSDTHLSIPAIESVCEYRRNNALRALVECKANIPTDILSTVFTGHGYYDIERWEEVEEAVKILEPYLTPKHRMLSSRILEDTGIYTTESAYLRDIIESCTFIDDENLEQQCQLQFAKPLNLIPVCSAPIASNAITSHFCSKHKTQMKD